MTNRTFDEAFEALTGNAPFPWQRALHERLLAGDVPASCDIPTGLGKTSVVAVWLLARAAGAPVPRRLVYVVNRRTVVDQTTDEIERLRENLKKDRALAGIEEELAISTLRGQMADNRAWSADPSQPAVICGTVDMIGSRLLFSGYRIGSRTRPLHAGFLGQDALIVHDEAHLEPAFQHLLETIQAEQARHGDRWPLRVMALTATPRSSAEALRLGAEDIAHPVVAMRFRATKKLSLHPHGDRDLVERVVGRALDYAPSGRAVLVFLRTVEDVAGAVSRLRKAGARVQQLTGTMRGFERDRLVAEDPIFRRFRPDPGAAAGTETAFLVCTSAGEVGVNLSADPRICDLSTFDSMAQRFGRMNRFGLRADSEIHVFHPDPESLDTDKIRDARRQSAPEIVAPPAEKTGAPYRLFVPDNVGDKVAKAWSAGREASLSDYRTEKDVRRARIRGEPAAVHYLFRGVEGLGAHLPALRMAARSITHLGWGIDMVAGDASDVVAGVDGERWIPGRPGGRALRRPVTGTLDALERKHALFLKRLDRGTFRPVPPLSTFALEPYARATDPAPKRFAGFRLLKPTTGDRLSLNPPRRTRDVAAWTRHAVGEVCEGWPFGPAEALVHGHAEEAGSREAPRARFSFLPLPTITPRLGRVEGIARVMVAAPPGLDEELEWVRVHLAGHDLVWKGEPMAFLEPLSPVDWVLRKYVGTSDHWSTVTPVVLPGHDDSSPRKAERLLRKAFLQGGFEPEVVDAIQELEWRKVGFRAGVDVANRYLPPSKISGPMFHVRVRFGEALAGPLANGAGRYRGMGVFAVL